MHTCKDFQGWIEGAHPHYHLVYVPGGCSGIEQSADVILQRPLTAGIVNAFSYWMTCAIYLLIQNGAAPNEVKVDTGVVTLKPLLVDWVWESWRNQKDKTTRIKNGSEKRGLGDVLAPHKHREVLSFVADNTGKQQPEELAGEEKLPVINVEKDDEEDEADESEEANAASAMNACVE